MPNKMNKIGLLAAAFVALAFSGCINENLSQCGDRGVLGHEDNEQPVVKLQVHWDTYNPALVPAKGMRINLQSLTAGYNGYGRDFLGTDWVKLLDLPDGTSHLAMAYNYDDCEQVFFRNESNRDIEAYCKSGQRNTYEKLMKQGVAPWEPLVVEPDRLYAATVQEFDVDWTQAVDDTLHLDMYPDSLSREFTYCIRNVKGTGNLASNGLRAALSGMAGSYFIARQLPVTTPSTVLVNSAAVKNISATACIVGTFRSFPPADGAKQLFCLETLSKGSDYAFALWDVSAQLKASMSDRAAKLARDGYDILIDNSEGLLPAIPAPPLDGEEGDNGGFDVDVNDWDDQDVYPYN